MAEKNSKKVKMQLPITGMTCATCAVTIEKGLAETEGVEKASVNFASEKATIEYDPTKVDISKIKATVAELGYDVATRKSIYPVGGMTCASCVAHVEEALRSVPGVVSVNVNLASEKATVEYMEGTQYADMKKAVEEAGYELGKETQTLEDVSETSRREVGKLRTRLIIAAVFTIPLLVNMIAEFLKVEIMFPGKGFLLWALATPVQFWAGWRFYKGAWGALKHRTSDMNTLIAVGTSAAYLYSVIAVLFPAVFTIGGMAPHEYFDTSATIVTLILLAVS